MNKHSKTVSYGMVALLFAALVAVVGWFVGGEKGGVGVAVATPSPLAVKEMKDLLVESRDNIQAYQKDLEDLRGHVDNLRRGGASRAAASSNGAVSEECARFLGAMVVAGCEIRGKLNDNPQRERLLRDAEGILGLQQRAALTSTDIPLPLDYGRQVTELVLKYGMARKYSTTIPFGAATMRLPRLKTSPAFGFIDQSATVPEKVPQIEFVDLTALKAGGLVRVPSEIDADAVVPLGQWLANYCAREMAKWEDLTMWIADGSATYKTRVGVCSKASTLGNKVQLTAGNSNPSLITLANMRTLRSKVDAAALGESAYYMHPSMESLLSSFNSATNLSPYQASGPNGPTLDGFPIYWIGVLPVYSTTTALSQFQLTFGAQRYWHLGVRNDVEIAVSRDVFFATDEIAVRCLERFDIGLLADNAMAVLQLAAS
jgi:HK97 family phage major capsid protein